MISILKSKLSQHQTIKIILSILLAFTCLENAAAEDWTACIAELPGHATYANNGEPQGDFVDLFHAINREYIDNKINIILEPYKTCLLMVSQGQVDIQFPTSKPHHGNPVDMSFIYAEPAIGLASFMVYYYPNNTIKDSGCRIGTGWSIEKYFDFPVMAFPSISSALNNLKTGEIDGLITEKDAGDLLFKNEMLNKRVKSQLYQTRPFYITVAKHDETPAILEKLKEILSKLNDSGELQALAEEIHTPVFTLPLSSEQMEACAFKYINSV